jgi:hypothetical protein
MKKLLVVLLLVATTATAAHAALKVIGKGSEMRLDPSSFPPVMKANYEIFRVKCTKCHSLERSIVAIQTGIAPISGQPFDAKAAQAYGAKMLRKSSSGMSPTDVKASVDLMDFLIAKTEQ